MGYGLFIHFRYTTVPSLDQRNLEVNAAALLSSYRVNPVHNDYHGQLVVKTLKTIDVQLLRTSVILYGY